MLKRKMVITIIWMAVFIFSAMPALAEIIVDTAWVRRYNGPGNSTDEAADIAVDGSGNVYVAGMSVGSGSNYDYVIIGYYANGDTSWLKRYNGPGNHHDVASALAVDDSDNVYVTGWSYDTNTGYDYVSIKYYPDGDSAWLRRYNRPSYCHDYARAIAVDGTGNVYVTGESCYEYGTVKYSCNGDTTWVRTYSAGYSDKAFSVVLDRSGNVYVTGASGNHYATVKYYPDGDTAWVRRYNGPGNSTDEAADIAVDGWGNVYVTGKSVGDGTRFDYATIKYYPNGDTAWVRRYNGSADWDDGARAIALDDSGNAYVTGYSNEGETQGDYTTIKYYPDGDAAWVRRYNGPGNGFDGAFAMAVDDLGNAYVTGYSTGNGTYLDYATVKYDSDGNQLWVERYNGPGNLDDWGRDVAVDGSGNVYVTGTSFGSGTDRDYATIKYVQFLRGDTNTDGVIDLEDVLYLINYLYKNGPVPVPILQVGDVDCDGVVDLGDVLYLINYLYKGGPPPCS